MEVGATILVAGVLLAIGIAAAALAGRLRVPGLVLFLGIGMALGNGGGLGWLPFEDIDLALTIGILALAAILFEGGLAAGWPEIRPVLVGTVSLAVVGTVLTAAITGAVAVWLLELSPLVGLLLGSIVATSDAAAIFSMLRGSNLRRRLARTLEGESALNDPVAILLVLGLIDWITLPEYGLPDALLFFTMQIAIGALVGLAGGRVAVEVFERLPPVNPGLYPGASLAAAGLSFGAADALGGSGFLAVYLTGLALGGVRFRGRPTIDEFHSGLAGLSEIGLFLALGLLVDPVRLPDIALKATLLAGALIVVARPIATLVATRVGGYELREALLLAWAGLRGAVPIVLALFPLTAGLPDAQLLFDIVFFVVVASTLVQGATIEPLARRLGLTTTEPALGRQLLEVGNVRRLGAEVLEYPIGSDDAIAGRLVRELMLPREALVSVIVRGDEALLPRGSSRLRAEDRLHILLREPVRREVEALFERWRRGPIGEPEAPPPPVQGRTSIFAVRPWRDAYGDPAAPEAIDGIAVQRRLRTRRGAAGALVQLEDGRFALTGEGVLAMGSARQVTRYCRGRIRRSSDDEARAWWQETAGALSERVLR